jgi:SAM-dependent methyltransferase
MNPVKKYLPKRVKKIIKSLIKPDKKTENLHFCPVCDNKTGFKKFPYQPYFEKFYEHGFVFSPFQFETLNLKQYKCHTCGATDRERIMALYLKEYLQDCDKKDLKLIDFAPVKALSVFLKNLKKTTYRSADLYRKDVDDKVDITNMTIYRDETFDIFICSHILEHIENDDIAMKELYRITKKNGLGLCLVPIMLSLDISLENKEYLETEHLRWKYFGQDDHVRMYSKNDFVTRLEKAGFKVEQYGQDHFGKAIFENVGLDEKSILYVVKK